MPEEATAKAMGIEEVRTAPRSPWQNAFVERFIGSARRECFDHVIVFNEAGLHLLMAVGVVAFTYLLVTNPLRAWGARAAGEGDD